MEKNLLIVDDDPINLRLFSIIADQHGWSYETAADGFKVEELLKNNAYEVMLLDIQLPGINGYGLLEKIKSAGLATKVIVVTAYAMREDKDKIMKAGADGYISKPVDIAQLIEKIQGYLDINKA